MAATAALMVAPNATAVANYRSVEDVVSTPFARLSFAASDVAGESITSSAQLRSRRRRPGAELERRSPAIVSPKAVSDSQNSQTCLDPDASRVLNSSSSSSYYFYNNNNILLNSVDFKCKAFRYMRSTTTTPFVYSLCFHLHVTNWMWNWGIFLAMRIALYVWDSVMILEIWVDTAIMCSLQLLL